MVESSRVHNANYSAQQASLDYHRGADTVFVRVRIDFTPTYGTAQYLANHYQSPNRPAQAPRRADFARDFRFAIVQDERRIEPLSIECHLTNTPSGGHFPFDPDGRAALMRTRHFGGGFSITGWLVWLQFDAQDLSSSDDAQIEILGPDDLHVTAKYDLSKLR